MHRFAFVMEQTLGHVTHYRNLQSTIDTVPAVSATWYPLPFEPQDRVETLPLLRSNWSARSSWRTWRVLSRDHARERYDALFFHTQITTLLCAPLMRRVPSVVSLDATPANIDSIGAAYAHRRGSDIVEGIKRTLSVRSLHAARAIVAFSDWVRHSLIADYGVPPERIHVIPPGIDVAQWSVPAHRLARNGHASGPFRLLFVGGDFERKGGPMLLDVFRQGLAERCELHLVTKATIEGEFGIHVYRDFGPNAPGLRALYERCDALVLPTRADTYSHVTIEAMACGLPVISCPVGGIPEIVRHAETGLLIPPNDGHALLEAIQTLCYDRERALSMGLAGREVVEKRYDAAVNAGRILDLMMTICAGTK